MKPQRPGTQSLIPPDWAYPLFAEYGFSRELVDFMFDAVPDKVLTLGPLTVDNIRRTLLDDVPILLVMDAKLKEMKARGLDWRHDSARGRDWEIEGPPGLLDPPGPDERQDT